MATPRRPRRQDADELDPTRITFSEAYTLEMSGTWPDWRTRRAFWGRPDVPRKFRPVSEPDPRPILAGESAAVYEATRKGWLRARVEWLRRQAEDDHK